MCLWDDDDNDRLFNEVFPHHHAAFRRIRRGVIKADIARLVYMTKFGGLYLDTDYKLLKPLDPVLERSECVFPVSRDAGAPEFRICNSIFAAARGYPFFTDFIEHIFNNADVCRLREDEVETTTGPEALTAFFLAHRDRYPTALLPERIAFHPKVTAKGFWRERDERSYGVHLCFGSWRSKTGLRRLKTLIQRKIMCF